MTFIIETERLRLRPWTTADVGALFAMCSDPEVMRYIGDGRAWVDVGRAYIWLERVLASYDERGYGPWAVVEKTSGLLVGSSGYSFIEIMSEVDFGYVFARDFWGRGYATEAGRAVLRYGFETLGLTEVTARVVPEHSRSRHVLEKLGFKYSGLKKYDDDMDDAFYVARNPLRNDADAGDTAHVVPM